MTGSTDTPPPAPVTSSRRVLALLRVSGTAGELRAVFSLDGREQRAEVGGSFGSTGELRLVAVQQGPADGQWTAVVRLGDGDPFDVVTGEAVAV